MKQRYCCLSENVICKTGGVHSSATEKRAFFSLVGMPMANNVSLSEGQRVLILPKRSTNDLLPNYVKLPEKGLHTLILPAMLINWCDIHTPVLFQYQKAYIFLMKFRLLSFIFRYLYGSQVSPLFGIWMDISSMLPEASPKLVYIRSRPYQMADT